jgi:hypothetical protein
MRNGMHANRTLLVSRSRKTPFAYEFGNKAKAAFATHVTIGGVNSRAQGVAAAITSLLLLTHVRAHCQSPPESAQSPVSNSGVTSPIKSQLAPTGEEWFDSHETDLPTSAATATPEAAPAPQPVPSARQFPETSRPLTNAARVNVSPQPKGVGIHRVALGRCSILCLCLVG